MERQTPVIYGKEVTGAEAPEIYKLPHPHSEHFIWPPKMNLNILITMYVLNCTSLLFCTTSKCHCLIIRHP